MNAFQPSDEAPEGMMVEPPFSAFAAPRTSVISRLDADQLSRPHVFVRLRRWALSQHDVMRVVLGHTGKRYTIAVMIAEPTLQRIREVHRELEFADELFGGALWEAYVLGPNHGDAHIFRSYGTQTVHLAA